MKPNLPVIALADPRRRMPGGAAARRAVAEAAVNALAVEQRQLALEGREWPQARNAYLLRYWRFVRAMCSVAEAA